MKALQINASGADEIIAERTLSMQSIGIYELIPNYELLIIQQDTKKPFRLLVSSLVMQAI